MASSAKFCPQCGHELPEPNPPFCSQCGAPVSASATPARNEDSSRSNILPVLLNAVFGAICLMGVGHFVERRYLKGLFLLVAGWILFWGLFWFGMVPNNFWMTALIPLVYISLWIYSIVEARRF